MNCCQCQGIEDLFNEKYVSRELSRYREKGPDKTTRMMIEALKAKGLEGYTLLDIGGGVGAIQSELFHAGLRNSVDVEASQSYISAAREEAQRHGVADRVTFQHGDFVQLANQITPADIVTLDRVICCYSDMENLVSLSAARARKLYGVVYPHDRWWVKVGLAVQNFFFRMQKSKYRAFVHSSRSVEAIIKRYGFKRCYYQRTLVWQVVVYER